MGIRSKRYRVSTSRYITEVGFMKEPIDRPLFSMTRAIGGIERTFNSKTLIPALRFILEHCQIDPESKIFDLRDI